MKLMKQILEKLDPKLSSAIDSHTFGDMKDSKEMFIALKDQFSSVKSSQASPKAMKAADEGMKGIEMAMKAAVVIIKEGEK